jgi:hypothetical protein
MVLRKIIKMPARIAGLGAEINNTQSILEEAEKHITL